jgi:hypothetical protein
MPMQGPTLHIGSYVNLNGVEFVFTLTNGSKIIVISLVRCCSFVNAATTESKRDHKLKQDQPLINHEKFFRCHKLNMHNAWGTLKHSCRFPLFPCEYDVDIPFLTSTKTNSLCL